MSRFARRSAPCFCRYDIYTTRVFIDGFATRFASSVTVAIHAIQKRVRYADTLFFFFFFEGRYAFIDAAVIAAVLHIACWLLFFFFLLCYRLLLMSGECQHMFGEVMLLLATPALFLRRRGGVMPLYAPYGTARRRFAPCTPPFSLLSALVARGAAAAIITPDAAAAAAAAQRCHMARRHTPLADHTRVFATAMLLIPRFMSPTISRCRFIDTPYERRCRHHYRSPAPSGAFTLDHLRAAR